MGKLSKKEIETRCNTFRKQLLEQDSFQELYKYEKIKDISTYIDFCKILLDMDIKTFMNKIHPNAARKDSYKVENHSGITEKGNLKGKKFKWEDREVIWFFNYYSQHKKDELRIIDYQIPMKDTNNDKERAIDALATDGENLYILEYKRFTSQESLLRSVLEIYTYLRLLNNGLDSFKKDFGFPDANVIPGILLMEGSTQYIELKKQTTESPIIKLITILGIEVFVISPSEVFFEKRNKTGIGLAAKRPYLKMNLCMKKIKI